jgi:hypothetical protein
MKTKTRRALALLGALLPLAASGETWRNHFDADSAARPPGFFDTMVLGAPGRANWIVVADPNPPSTPNQLTQTVRDRPKGSIAAALRRNVAIQDGTVAAALKKLPVVSGLVFRLTGDKDFLVLLLDGTSGEAILTAYRGGMPTELARGKANLQNEWGNLKVTLARSAVSATWNEAELLAGKDDKPASGRTGVATEGPGIAAFDELVIDDGKP